MCRVRPPSQRPGVFQPALAALRPSSLQRSLGVLLHAVSERVLQAHGAPAVIDPSDMEIAAMRSALGPLGEYVASIGMDRPLADYGKDEVLRLVEVVVDAYQAHMLAEHERMVERDRTFFEQLASRKATAGTGGDHHRIPF